MARTINGELTGKAAHRSADDVPSEPLDPEILLAIKKDFLALEIHLRDTSPPDSLDWNTHNRIVEKMQSEIELLTTGETRHAED